MPPHETMTHAYGSPYKSVIPEQAGMQLFMECGNALPLYKAQTSLRTPKLVNRKNSLRSKDKPQRPV